MPMIDVVFYRDRAGTIPVLEWLDEIQVSDRKGWASCIARIERLKEAGHELRRPEADYLRDGIYELRAKHGHVQYRILYFFNGRNVAILAHSIVKEGSAVPPMDIERASRRKAEFESSPLVHVHRQELRHGD
jgi:phage-related protein